MGSEIVASLCNYGKWSDTSGNSECICGKIVYEEGDPFADISPEYKSVETVSLDLNKMVPFLMKYGIDNFLF